VATDAQGRIYVVDGDTVQQFDVSRTFLRRFGDSGDVCFGNLVSSGGIASDASGNTYVADPQANCVHKFGPDGSFVLPVGSPGSAQGELQNPRDVATDAEGSAYVLDVGNHRVQKFSSQGAFLQAWGVAGTGPGQFDDPNAIALSRSGDVYVSEPSRVQRFDKSGTFISQWSVPHYAQSLAVNSAGEVYVAEGYEHRIERFNAAGDLIDGFGRPGTDNGEFRNPIGVGVDCRGNVYVADNNNSRVQKFGTVGAPDPPCSASPTSKLAAARRAPRARRFSARFSSSASEPGAMAQRNGKLSETGALQRGTFRIKAPGTALFRRGKWYGLFNVAGEPLKRRGTATGTLLTTSRNKRGGQLCMSFRVTLRVVRKKLDVRGKFTTLGGTRRAARLRGGGSYVQTRSAGESWTIRGKTTARQGKRRSLPARCRAVKRAHHLR
jgi:streptogramin lyase